MFVVQDCPSLIMVLLLFQVKLRLDVTVEFHSCVNIGASRGKNGAPIIGNNVYIGPGAILFGDITIADNVSIGANATVNRSFTESNVVIAGTPAEIVKRNVPAWNEV